MDADVEIETRALQAAANWHGAWAVAFGLCGLLWPPDLSHPALRAALWAAAAPGLVGQTLRVPWMTSFARGLVAGVWPVTIGAAIALSGGLAGPLAVLALAPMAALATLSGRRLVAAGAASTAAIVAGVALAAAFGVIEPSASDSPWLPLVAVALTAIGLAAALQLASAGNGAREAARAGEVERLRSLLRATPHLLLRLDKAGVIREAFTGAPDDRDLSPVGQPFDNLAAEIDRWAASAAVALARRGIPASVGFAPPMAPDRFLAVELRALPRGEVAALVRDASHERASEASLVQGKADAEALAMARSQFLANMSHELRTPLNAIIGFSDSMRSKLFGPISDRYAEYAGLIHESGGHLLGLINDVLDMSKIEANHFNLTLEAFDAREAVSAALRLVRGEADKAGIALRGALPPDPLEVNADRRAIKQMVLNLVANSLKFTPAGGQVNVLARERGGELELIVADTGAGIAPADLERIGRPYEQAGDATQRAKGTGLGLSLVRALAELHGGSMTIKSILGEGTAVSIRMPVLDHEMMAKTPPVGGDGDAGPPPPGPFAETTLEAAASPDAAARAIRGDNVIAFHPHR